MLIASQLITEAQDYTHDALQDRLPETGKPSKSYFSDAAGTCALFAREFGWGDEETLDKPMKRLLQYMKEMSVHCGSKVPLFNPSDDELNVFLIQRNKKAE